SLAELAASHAAATAQNNLDWPDDDSQRATNQHFIDVMVGRRTRDIIQAKADLDRSVADWLDQSNSDGGPQVDRPSLSLWLRLNEGEQRAVDGLLARNAGPVPMAIGDNDAGQMVNVVPFTVDSGQASIAHPNSSHK